MTRPTKKVMCIATVVYALVLIALSVLPSGEGRLGGWDEDIAPSLQNVLHVPAYALLAVLVTSAVLPSHGSGCGRVLLGVVCCCIFGVILEFAQCFVPGRSASAIDAALNVIGVLSGVGVVVVCRSPAIDDAPGNSEDFGDA